MPSAIRFNNGLLQPSFGLGTWAWGANPVGVANAVRIAIDCGYRHIDCAAVYGNEQHIGEVFKQVFDSGKVKRDEMFITSKLWVDQMNPSRVEAACRKTLCDLQLSYLDLYLVHWPFERTTAPGPYNPTAYLATWRAMEHLVDLGIVRSIGVSNMTVSKLTALLPDCRIKPAANQVELHPYLAQTELVNYCKAQDIALTAYCPLGRPPQAPTDKPNLLTDPVVVSVAKEVGATPAQVVLAWNMQRGIAVVPKSVSEARLKENLQAVNVTLSPVQMEALNKLNRNLRLVTANFLCWKPNQAWEDLWL